jgi:hypothetical protein
LRINYKKPTILDELDEAIKRSIESGKSIESIELTGPELSKFCDALGYAFSKGCGYDYKNVRISYY